MYLFRKYFDDINEEDLRSLVANKVPEGKTLEYKSEWTFTKDADKKEFLYDVAALANTEGGIIIYGIIEGQDDDGRGNGFAEDFKNVNIGNQDTLKLTIEQTIRSGIEPKIYSIGVRFFNIDGNNIFILGVSRFIGLPHMVIRDKTNKFYLRSNTGKYLADINEIHALFMNNYLISERIKNFVQKKIEDAQSHKVYSNLETKHSFFLHIVPIRHFGENIIDFSTEETFRFLHDKINLLTSISAPARLGLEGFMKYYGYGHTINLFSHLYRDGVAEYYSSLFHSLSPYNEDLVFVYGGDIELAVHRSLQEVLYVYRHLAIEPPYSVFIYFLNPPNLYLNNTRSRPLISPGQVMSIEHVMLPSLTLTTNETGNLWTLLKPVFDVLWQAGGFHKSPNYNEDGTRKSL